MSTTSPSNSSDQSKDPKAEIQKGIDSHKKAAMHSEEAAKNHRDAAKHHEDGNHDKAMTSAVKANGHLELAADAQKENSKNHALNS